MSTLEASVDFLTNSQPRCACVLILDTSGSMQGDSIKALNEGLQVLRDELAADSLASQRVEIAVVEFNTNVNVVRPFATVDKFQPPTLTAQGMTDLVGGITQGLDLVEQRKKQYEKYGIPCYRPWAFLITDGEVEPKDYENVIERIHRDHAQKSISFFAIGVQGANEECLRKISVQEHKMLDGFKFKELFQWLSVSLQFVSSRDDTAGEMRALPPTGRWEA